MNRLRTLTILLCAAALPAVAQQKISERTTLAGASIDTAADWVPIVDTSAGASGDKKTSLAEMWNALGGTNVSAAELGYLDGVTSAVQTQLNAKQATLVSGTNLKTVNGTSLLGSGNITAGAIWGSITGTLSDQTDLQSAIGLKVSTSQLSQVGGANKVLQVGSTGITRFGPAVAINGLADDGAIGLSAYRELKFMNFSDVESASIYLQAGHSGGDELVIGSPRIAFGFDQGMQIGYSTAYTTRHPNFVYLQPLGGATSGDPTRESIPFMHTGSWWNGSAESVTSSGSQYVPLSASDGRFEFWVGMTGQPTSDGKLTSVSGGARPLYLSKALVSVNAANLDFPSTTSTTGSITQNGTRFAHSYGTANLFLGGGAGNYTLTGNNSVGIGAGTLASLTSGARNVSLAYSGMPSLTTGSDNTAVGNATLSGQISNSDSTAIGSSAGGVTTGNGMSFVGSNAGYNLSGSNAYATALGAYAGSLAAGQTPGLSRWIALGVDAYTTQSNTCAIGAPSGTDAVDLAVGVSAPSAKVHIQKTTEQLRVGYDASNYFKATVGSTGGVTVDAVGSGAAFTLSDALTVGSDTLILTTAKTPASASATGTQGQIAWDASYIYICTATNTWKRVAIATW